jgi:hypothetical protein
LDGCAARNEPRSRQRMLSMPMIYSNLFVNEPIEKISEDWDYLDERVVATTVLCDQAAEN